MEWNSMDGRLSRRGVVVCAALALASLLTACSSDNKNTTSSAGGGGGEGGSGATGGTGGTGGAGGAGGEGGMPLPKDPEFVAKFDPALGQLPEGFAIEGDFAYVAYTVDPKVVKVNLLTGEVSDFGTIQAPIGIGFPQGVTIDKDKNVLVAVKSENPAQFKPGIYKFPPTGGMGTLYIQEPSVSFPRTLTFTDFGLPFITAPTSAELFAVDATLATSQYAKAQDLGGDQSSGCAYGMGTPYGVTSLFATAPPGGTDLEATYYWTNADRASVFKATWVPNGPVIVFTPELLAGPDCATLGGAESLVMDNVAQGMIVAARKANKITRVTESGQTTVLVDGKNLYEPSALAIAVTGNQRYLYILNSASASFQTGGIPSLAKLSLGGVE